MHFALVFILFLVPKNIFLVPSDFIILHDSLEFQLSIESNNWDVCEIMFGLNWLVEVETLKKSLIIGLVMLRSLYKH